MSHEAYLYQFTQKTVAFFLLFQLNRKEVNYFVNNDDQILERHNDLNICSNINIGCLFYVINCLSIIEYLDIANLHLLKLQIKGLFASIWVMQNMKNHYKYITRK